MPVASQATKQAAEQHKFNNMVELTKRKSGELGAANPWHTVLRPATQEPVTEQAINLISMLQAPPPLAQVHQTARTLERYNGVPTTPAARRRNVPDKKLWDIQNKLENAMHAFVASCEQGKQAHMMKAIAFIRSAFQDVHEQRRHNLAKSQAWQLDKRPDDTQPTLLTKDEENEIRSTNPPTHHNCRSTLHPHHYKIHTHKCRQDWTIPVQMPNQK